MIDKQMEITLAPLNAPALALAIEQIMLMQDKAVRLENAAAEIERYVTSRSAKTVPMEMLLSIAGVSEHAATETTTEFCARIADRYGYTATESAPAPREEKRAWELDRYRPRIGKMAEGVSVHAGSLEEAIKKAHAMYTDPEDAGTTFKLHPQPKYPQAEVSVAKDARELAIAIGQLSIGPDEAHMYDKVIALIQSSFEAWQAAEQTALDEPGYWWCPECEEEITSTRVTFQECHDTCGRHVIWKEPIAALLAHEAPKDGSA